MDSTYLVAGVAIALLAIVFAWYEVARLKKEIARHKSAAVNFRAFVVKQKRDAISAIVIRLKLKDVPLPPLDVGLYSKIVDIYDSPEMIPHPTPVLATGRYDINWTVDELEYDELFILWMEGIIEHGSA